MLGEVRRWRENPRGVELEAGYRREHKKQDRSLAPLVKPFQELLHRAGISTVLKGASEEVQLASFRVEYNIRYLQNADHDQRIASFRSAEFT